MTGLAQRLALRVLPHVGASAIRLLGRSLSWRVCGAETVDELYRQGHHPLIAFWHGQQLMMPLAYRGRLAHILISRHRDGELICRIVRRFGFGAVRGSTTRGGAGALRQLIRLGRRGVDLVVTPDGPKGPRHVVQSGVVALARATGMPIVPLTFACSKKKRLPAGTGLFFRIRSRARCFCGARRFGWPVTPTPTPWNARGWQPRRRSPPRCPTRRRWYAGRSDAPPSRVTRHPPRRRAAWRDAVDRSRPCPAEG